jgi:hypothetical protein
MMRCAREWLETEPDLVPGEIWRRLRDTDTPLGLTKDYRERTDGLLSDGGEAEAIKRQWA